MRTKKEIMESLYNETQANLDEGKKYKESLTGTDGAIRVMALPLINLTLVQSKILEVLIDIRESLISKEETSNKPKTVTQQIIDELNEQIANIPHKR